MALPISGMLFPNPDLPEGFLYQPDFITAEEEESLLAEISRLPFAAFDFHGYTAKRRVVEYGLEYDFSTRRANPAAPFPDFLMPLRERAAALANLTPETLVEGIVTEYSPGTPIGWHRDAPQFGTVIGISLAGSCRMRFKPYQAPSKSGLTEHTRVRPLSIILEPRSAYVIRGAVRWRFQHSIPPVEQLRYSITFRTLRGKE
jgi:alkylated DNA repair dioxygenase AlkB